MKRPCHTTALVMAACSALMFNERSVLVQEKPPQKDRPVYIAGGLSADQFVVFSANVLAANERAVVLADVPENREYLKTFLKEYEPSTIVLAGAVRSEALAGASAAELAHSAWQDSMPADLWKHLFAKAAEVVVCSKEPRRSFLEAASFAGAIGAPLYVLEGPLDSDAELQAWLKRWETVTVHAIGNKAAKATRALMTMKVNELANERAIQAAHLERLLKKGPISTLVLANSNDILSKRPAMSALAPLVAITHHAPLVLTNDQGDDAAAQVEAAISNASLKKAEHLVIVADLKAVSLERRPNPLAGKDEFIEVEPPGYRDGGPFSFSTGRLFHARPGVVTLMLARQKLLSKATRTRNALVVSNPGGGLPLLETISRNTASEIRNAGYETTALFHQQARREPVHRLLADQDIFLWEGHHSTLLDFGIPYWPEPLKPSLIFLQSCLALTEAEAQPFLGRGAVGVIGSPFRNYSATGGAFTLAYFDALLYDQQSFGEALRQAKNFLLCYAQLKERRLGEEAKLNGASLRSAWAFSLWGDPTVKFPPPENSSAALPPFRAIVKADQIVFPLPAKAYEEVRTEQYLTHMWPNGRLAGYVTKAENEGRKTLLPLLFAEIALPRALANKLPRLRSNFPADRWAFTWDSRRNVGYLLVLPRKSERQDIRFDVEWH